MHSRNIMARTMGVMRLGLTGIAVTQLALGVTLANAAQSSQGSTKTPIKHVIVLIGENRTFDHLFATYVPKSRDSVKNLLSEGIINAGTRNAVYLGLIEIEAIAGNASFSSPSTQLPSQLQMLPMEPFRAILDGVIAALSDDIATPPPQTARHHRGARTWFCDTVLLQVGWPVNKRLAERVIRSSNHDDSKRLSRLAGANRRAARVEDAEIVRWIDQQEQVLSSIASP